MNKTINIQDYFKKYAMLCSFEEGSPEYLIDKEDFIIAAKEIVEAAIDMCAEEAKLGSEDFGDLDTIVDRKSILDVKNMIKYE